MTGKLILVSGLSGAGKTTLVAGALKHLPSLEYLRTYTTRPMRPGEENNHEYVFVDAEQYGALRKDSPEWDHTEYEGFFYGADASSVTELLANGKTVICSVAPDLGVVEDMAKLYGVEPITVWIKTPKDVAKQRIYQDDIRDARNEDFAISTNFDYIFTPVGVIDEDTAAFVKFLESVVG